MKLFRNRTVIGVLCILLSLVICFGITPKPKRRLNFNLFLHGSPTSRLPFLEKIFKNFLKSCNQRQKNRTYRVKGLLDSNDGR